LGTGNQIIADSVYVFGTGDKIINYNGRNPSPITTAYLVEYPLPLAELIQAAGRPISAG
jgi:hypothetical protein